MLSVAAICGADGTHACSGGGPSTKRTSGSDDTDFNLGDGTISDECQANFDATIEQAYEYGINHFETARGYGCSEKQFCQSLRCGTIRPSR